MIDVNAIRWESLAAVGGVLAVAVWALRDPASATPPGGDPHASVGRFRVYQRNRTTRIAEIEDGVVIGRGSDCGLRVEDATVSKHHARFSTEGGAWLEDLDSTNGTYVNGRRVEGTTVLRRGDRIALGAAKIVFLGLAPRGHTRPKG